MKEKTKILLLVIGGCFILGLTTLNYMYFSEKNKEKDTENIPVNSEEGIEQTEILGGLAADTEPAEDVVYKAVQTKFDEMLNVMTTLKLPSYFDKSENNPIHSISAVYPMDSNYYTLQITFIDETTQDKVSYMVKTDKTEFESAKKDGKKHTLSNGLDIYFYNGVYHWKDGNLYGDMGSLDFITTDQDKMFQVINSLSTDAKYQIKDIIDYQAGDKILKPTLFVEDNEPVTVTIEYARNHEIAGKESTQVAQSYTNFDMKESKTLDYVKDGFMSDSGIEEKQISGKVAYYDTNLATVFYNTAERSIVLSPKTEDILTDDEYYKVLEEMVK